jgi:hypothetical protein
VVVGLGVGVGVSEVVGVGVFGPTEHKGLSTIVDVESSMKTYPVPSANNALGFATIVNELS